MGSYMYSYGVAQCLAGLQPAQYQKVIKAWEEEQDRVDPREHTIKCVYCGTKRRNKAHNCRNCAGLEVV